MSSAAWRSSSVRAWEARAQPVRDIRCVRPPVPAVFRTSLCQPNGTMRLDLEVEVTPDRRSSSRRGSRVSRACERSRGGSEQPGEPAASPQRPDLRPDAGQSRSTTSPSRTTNDDRDRWLTRCGNEGRQWTQPRLPMSGSQTESAVPRAKRSASTRPDISLAQPLGHVTSAEALVRRRSAQAASSHRRPPRR